MEDNNLLKIYKNGDDILKLKAREIQNLDGSVVAFQGCLGVNFDATLTRRWSLYTAYLQPLVSVTMPGSDTIAAALNAACY